MRAINPELQVATMATTVARILKIALLLTFWLALCKCTAETGRKVSSNDANAASIPPALLTGRVLAGSTPIKNATVTLFGRVVHARAIFASASSEPVSETYTDAEGRFSFDLSKAHAVLMIAPRRVSPLVRVEVPPEPGTLYLLASGGDAGGGDNPAITLATALGTPSPEGRVVVNELTTVVAAFAVGGVTTDESLPDNSNQWLRTATFPMAVFPPGGTTSPPSHRGDEVNLAGETPSKESLALACQLVDPATGRLQPLFSSGANSPALVNTLADILHSCIVSHGPDFAECGALFQAATLSNPWKLSLSHKAMMASWPHNTLTATESITATLGRTNSALFRLLPSQLPYLPVLKQAPAGWLLSLNFQGLGLHRPTAILADPSDSTLWVLNSGNQTLTELSTDPKDFTNPLLGTRRVPEPVREKPMDFWFNRYYFDEGEPAARPTTPGWFSEPSVWLAHGRLVFLNADGTTCASPFSGLDLKGARGLSGRTLNGGIFIANTEANELLVLSLPKGACDGVRVLAQFKAPLAAPLPKFLLANPAHVLACPRSDLVLVTNGSGNSVSGFLDYSCPTAVPGTPFRGGGLSDPEGIDCDNGIWIANHAAKSVTELTTGPDPGLPIARPPCLNRKGRAVPYRFRLEAVSPSSGFSGAGLNRPYGVASDGLGNVWITNEGNDSLTVLIGAGSVPSGDEQLTGG